MSKTHSPFWHPHGVYITTGAYTTNTKFRNNCLANNIAVESGDVWKRFLYSFTTGDEFWMRATPWQYPIASANINVWSFLALSCDYQLGHHSATQPLGSRQWVNKLEDVGWEACCDEIETLMLDDVLKVVFSLGYCLGVWSWALQVAKLFEVCMLKDGASFRTEAKPMAVAWASHTQEK